MSWQVRHEGSPQSVAVSSAVRVLEGLRDGEWEPGDEVRGPADRAWVAIADHPLFADAAAELEPPKPEPPDESRLDMNPLIDVALVLLIFFILTTSYSSMRRAIELPPAPPEEQKTTVKLTKQDMQDRVFKVKVSMVNGKPVIDIEGRGGVTVDELEHQIKDVVKNTGRKEMFVAVENDVPWGIEAKVYDAAKAADIHTIYWPRGK